MGTVSVNPPQTPVTDGVKSLSVACVPHVCKMPGPPAPFVPTPMPNVGRSGDSPEDYSKNVKFDGHKIAIKGAKYKSVGDQASQGTGGGVVSAQTHGVTKLVSPGSMNVKVEGKNVHLLGDFTTNDE